VSTKQKLVGFIGYDGVTSLDIVGPMDAFAAAGKYISTIVGLTSNAFASESGVVFKPTHSIHTAPELDTLVIPGGRGVRVDPLIQARVCQFVASRAQTTRRIVSVCTGVYGIAPTGLLNGRRITTHWRFAADFAAKYPKIQVDSNALYIKSDKFYTSAGVTAGIDLALSLIEEDFGRELSLDVARELVVYLKRPGGQEQYSEPLQFQARAEDAFADIVAWMTGHLQEDLSIDALAERASLCPRHFSRKFKAAFGMPPAAFTEKLRLDEARKRLTETSSPVASIAASVGFSSDDTFRRAFERHYDIPPTAYRGRFASAQASYSHEEWI